MPEIESLIREVTRTQGEAFTPSPDLPQRIMRRAHQRARRRRIAAAATAVVLAVALAVGVPLSLRGEGRRGVRVATEPTPITAPVTPTSGPVPRFEASQAPAVDINAPEPTMFIGGIGGGQEREAVVSATTGAVLRYLTPPPGGQVLPRVSPDRRALYTPALAGCGRSWTAIDIGTGATEPVFTELGNPFDVAPSPDGQKLAYARPLGEVGKGCIGYELVVREVSSGQERVWSGFATNIIQLTWSLDSAQLAYELAGPGLHLEPHLLDINTGTSVSDGIVLQAPDGGCTLALPRFRPGTENVVLAQNCLRRKAELLDFDRRTGALTARALLASDDVYGVIDLSMDASGRHVIYVLSYYGAGATATVFVLRDHGPVAVRTDCFTVAW